MEASLTTEDVKSILGSFMKEEELQKSEIEVSKGCKKGDGYLSLVTRVDVKTSSKLLHLIIKSAPKTPEMRTVTPIRMCFLREIYVYETFIPTMHKYQKDKGVLAPVPVAPKFYHANSEEFEELLVLGNLRVQGFGLYDRKIPIDDSHISLVFREYGKLHATSLTMKHNNRELFDSIAKTLAPRVLNKSNFGEEFFTLFELAAEKLQTLCSQETEPHLFEAVVKFGEDVSNFFDRIEAVDSKYCAFVHGDTWVNNIMFKYEDELKPDVPTGICLLDFQITTVASPVQDISTIFYTSASKDVLDKLDYYLKVYHDSLSEHMRLLGGDPDVLFPFEALKSEWKTYAKYGLNLGYLSMAAITSDDKDVVDFQDITSSGRDLKDFVFRSTDNDAMVNERLKYLVIHMYENDLM